MTCYRCMMKHCLCQSLKPFQTETKFIILIHPKELKKEKAATGRLTKLSLLNSEMIDGISFTENDKVNKLLQDPQYYPMLLYPGVESLNLSKNQFDKTNLGQKKLMIFILDGTWTCAKKMLKLSPNLQALPRLSFTPTKPSEFLIKQQPHPDCLSTIESTSFLVEELNRVGIEKTTEHDHMIVVFREMRDFFIACAKDPNRQGYRRSNYTTPSERKPALTKRRLFFET
ncbi:MAG: tRNA-uridine aminocarboxypropyltransferase [Bacteriovoracaceae bacterium]